MKAYQLNREDDFPIAHAAAWAPTPEEYLKWTGAKFSFPFVETEFDNFFRDNHVVKLILRNASHQAIGYSELARIDPVAKKLSFARIILRPEDRGKGAGRIFLTEMISYSITSYDLASIDLIVFSHNVGAIQLYASLGFREIEDSSFSVDFGENTYQGYKMILQLSK